MAVFVITETLKVILVLAMLLAQSFYQFHLKIVKCQGLFCGFCHV